MSGVPKFRLRTVFGQYRRKLLCLFAAVYLHFKMMSLFRRIDAAGAYKYTAQKMRRTGAHRNSFRSIPYFRLVWGRQDRQHRRFCMQSFSIFAPRKLFFTFPVKVSFSSLTLAALVYFLGGDLTALRFFSIIVPVFYFKIRISGSSSTPNF